MREINHHPRFPAQRPLLYKIKTLHIPRHKKQFRASLFTIYSYLHMHTHLQFVVIETLTLKQKLLTHSCSEGWSMEGYGYGSGSDHHPYGGDRRVEIMSGKSYSFSQNNASRGGSSGESTRASHSGAASVGKPWSFGDPQTKRRKRIARYQVYAVEGKVKATLRNGIRWIKHTCSRIVHGY